MKEGLNITQNTALTQTLAPVQVQFVKLLEMNTAAIEDEVRRRLDENPALEETPDSAPAEEFPETDDFPLPPTAYFPAGSAERMPIEANPDAPDMRESLIAQLDELDIDRPTRALAEYIVGALDGNGRLTRSPEAMAHDVSMTTGIDISPEMLRPALDAVRSLDPPGIGASDLRDCLLLQARRRDDKPANVLACRILDKYFDLFASGRLDRLQSRLGVTADELEDAVKVIRALNPKPGNSDTGDLSQRMLHITPDFIVEPDENDPEGRRFLISLAQRLPGLAVSESYLPGSIKASSRQNREALAFVRSKSREASEFIDLLERRNSTLLDVMRAIVDIQHEFFATDDPALIRPMVLKDVSAKTGRDMSVISRSTNGKYVATRNGVYPLKMFFNERPHEDSDVSSHRILETLREIIDAEDKSHPLSDDALTEMLASRGLEIARRTVAKYREQLHIPNSRTRRTVGPRK